MLARVVHENPPHGRRRRAVEVPPAVEAHLAQHREAQIQLVDQRGRLQRVPVAFVPQESVRHPAQLPVHQREQLLHRGGVAVVPAVEQLCDVSHVWRDSAEF